MRRLYLDVDAGGGKYLSFAKKKLQALRERNAAIGVEYGRKLYEFDRTSIYLWTNPQHDRIRIKTDSPAAFFVIYSALDIADDFSTFDIYQYVIAYDPDGEEVWRITLPPYEAISGNIDRGLLGCSADGTKVLFSESDGTTMWIRRIVDGQLLEASDGFSLASLSGAFDTNASSARVSADGTRAFFIAGTVGASGWVSFYYGESLPTKLHAFEMTTPWTYKTGASFDLSVVYYGETEYVSSTSPLELSRVTYSDGDTPELVEDIASIPVSLAGYDEVAVNTFDVSRNGSVALAYVLIKDLGDTTNDLRHEVMFEGGDSQVLYDNPSETGDLVNFAAYSTRLFSLMDDQGGFAYRLRSSTSISEFDLSGVVVAEVNTMQASDEFVLDLSPDGLAYALSDSGQIVVRRSEGDFEVPSYTNPAHGSGSATIQPHVTSAGAEVYAMGSGDTTYPVRKWSEVFDEDGVLTGYSAEPTEYGGYPSSIDVEVDLGEDIPPLELSASVVQTVNVYTQRLL